MALTPHFGGETDAPINLPRPVLLGAAALAMSVVLFAGAAKRTGVGRDQPRSSTAVAARTLNFVDQEDGGVRVIDPSTGLRVTTVLPGTGGFVRGVLRALVRERRADGVGADQPFVLTRWQDGRLTLDDVATRRRLELTSFGPDNAAVFDDLLVRPER